MGTLQGAIDTVVEAVTRRSRRKAPAAPLASPPEATPPPAGPTEALPKRRRRTDDTSPKRMGRPEKFTPEVRAKLLEAIRSGATRDESARRAGISRTLLLERLASGRADPTGEMGAFARDVELAEAEWAVAKSVPGLKRRKRGGVEEDVRHLVRVLQAGDVDPAEVELLAAAALDDTAGMKALRDRAVQACREHLLPFAVFVYRGKKPWFQVNWHHRVLAEFFERAARGEAKRGLISTPPRHGKTELMRLMCAWLLGVDPDANIIAGAYSAKLARASSLAVKRLVASPEYREVFPDVRLPDRREILAGEFTCSAMQWQLAGGGCGGYYASGLNGSVTGFGGGYVLVDDPCKSRQEAESPIYQDNVRERFVDDWASRQEEPGVQIVMATRWAARDLIGQLLEEAKADPDADQWEVINLPAILRDDEERHPADPREIGDPLWPMFFLPAEQWEAPPPEAELKAHAIKELEKKIKRTEGGEALFQGSPVSREGGIIKVEWLARRWTRLPEVPGEWLQSWDPKNSDSKKRWASHTVGQLWFRPHGHADCYLVDELRGQVGYDGAVQMLHALTDKYPQAGRKLIEKTGYGGTMLDQCKIPHSCGGQLVPAIPGLNPVDPRGKKWERLESVIHLLSAGNVIIPDASVRTWVPDWVNEVTRFSGKKTDVADRVDAMSQALDVWKTKSTPFQYTSGAKRQAAGFR